MCETAGGGFTLFTLRYGGVVYSMWDAGGSRQIRQSLFRHYTVNTEVLMFVVDCSRASSFEEASEELQLVTNTAHFPLILILANKQDTPDAATPADVVEALSLNDLPGTWHIHSCSASTGDGLFEAFDWLSAQVKML